MERCVCFDFEANFTDGSALQGHSLRFAIENPDISDEELARRVVSAFHLASVSSLRVLKKEVAVEPDTSTASPPIYHNANRIDLSHVIEHGMVTYQGLPAPLICDHLSREASRAYYESGTEFQIGRIEMVGNTGTYLDTPYHRFSDGHDLAELALHRVADCEAVVIDVTGESDRAVGANHFEGVDFGGKAVLVHTGWDRHWRTDHYFEAHPYLTGEAAQYLRDRGALLVGIDSYNVDDTSGGARPVHTVLLGAGIPIVEHMTELCRLPAAGFRFSAVPPKIRAMGTFPVRAYAIIAGGGANASRI